MADKRNIDQEFYISDALLRRAVLEGSQRLASGDARWPFWRLRRAGYVKIEPKSHSHLRFFSVTEAGAAKVRADEEKDAAWERERLASRPIAKMQRALLERGIRMSVEMSMDRCGCCSSPQIKFECDGVVIFDDDGAEFDMFKDDANGH